MKEASNMSSDFPGKYSISDMWVEVVDRKTGKCAAMSNITRSVSGYWEGGDWNAKVKHHREIDVFLPLYINGSKETRRV